jgi:stage V sporulation protein G
MKITRVRIAPVHVKNKLLGYAEIVIDDCFCVRDFKIIRQRTGYHIAVPQVKLENGSFKDIAFALDAETRIMIENAVIAEYEKGVGKAPPRRKKRVYRPA